jgi:hypothetical protein
MTTVGLPRTKTDQETAVIEVVLLDAVRSVPRTAQAT